MTAEALRVASRADADAVWANARADSEATWTTSLAATGMTEANGVFLTRAPVAGLAVEVRAVGNPSSGDAPQLVDFPVNFFDIRVQGGAVGGSTTLTLFVPPWKPVSTNYKFGPTPDRPSNHWYEFAFDGVTGAQMLADRTVLHLVDGQRDDDDLTANGLFRDDDGPGNTPGVLQFTTSNYNVDETGRIETPGIMTITVSRTGGSSGPVAVNYEIAQCDAIFRPSPQPSCRPI